MRWKSCPTAASWRIVGLGRGRSDRDSGQRAGVRIDVADTGPGIRHEDLECLFEPFFTTKATGSGLGLPIRPRTRSQLHGGVGARSTRKPGPAPRFPSTCPPPSSGSHSREKDPDRRQRRRADALPHPTVRDDRATRCLPHRRRSRPANCLARRSFDLILLDYKMPGLNGLETLAEIKRAQLKTPVIVMTAHGTTETAIEAMKLGRLRLPPQAVRHRGAQTDRRRRPRGQSPDEGGRQPPRFGHQDLPRQPRDW